MEAKPKYILLIPEDGEMGRTSLNEAILREKYGNDLVMMTPEEAKKQGLGLEDFANIPQMKIEASPLLHMPIDPMDLKCGKAKRRERRATERKTKKR